MPGGNGTGPAGMGPMTGRAAGHCAGYAAPGCVNPVGGRGFGGRGRGGGGGLGGRGRRNRFYATGLPGWQRAAMGYQAYGDVAPSAVPYAEPFAPTMNREQQLDALKEHAKGFEDALDDIRKRIDELEANTTND